VTFLSKYGRVLTAVLLLQAVLFYAVASRAEIVPAMAPLSTFPGFLPGWRMVRDIPIDDETQQILKADDILNRVYVDDANTDAAYFFVAFFKTQRSGQAPHSPKNCLPGAGWEPLEMARITIPVDGRSTPIDANRYVVAHGEEKSVVLYWYQSHERIIASEYKARIYLVADAIRYRHSDTALVKVVIPVQNNDIHRAEAFGIRFVKAMFPPLQRQLPS
jgi:EpsI family protein